MENKVLKQRLAFALKCKPEEVPETDEEIKAGLDKRRDQLREVKRGKSIH